MSPSWLDRSIDAWCHHPQAGGQGGEEVLATLLTFMSDDVRYEDVPTGAVFVRHAESGKWVLVPSRWPLI